MIVNISAETLEVFDKLERKAKAKLSIAEKHLLRNLSVENAEQVRTLKAQVERISEALDHVVYLYGCRLGLLKPSTDNSQRSEANNQNSTSDMEYAA